MITYTCLQSKCIISCCTLFLYLCNCTWFYFCGFGNSSSNFYGNTSQKLSCLLVGMSLSTPTSPTVVFSAFPRTSYFLKLMVVLILFYWTFSKTSFLLEACYPKLVYSSSCCIRTSWRKMICSYIYWMTFYFPNWSLTSSFVAGWPYSSSDPLQIFHKELFPSLCSVLVKWFKQETFCLPSLYCPSLFPLLHIIFAGVWFHLLRPECWQHLTSWWCLWSSARQISMALKLVKLHCLS